MTKVFLSQKMKFDIGLELSKHCLKNEAGLAVYEQGWDDERIAKMFGPTVRRNHVHSIRRSLIGHLFAASKGKSTVNQRLTDIENYLTSKNPNWKA